MTTEPRQGETRTEQLDRGTFEIVRDRLIEHSASLAGATNALNQRRLEIFGGGEMAVLGSERIRTENNCVPRDIAGIGELFLFGYNVFIGLRREISVADAFSLHRCVETDLGFEFPQLSPGDPGYFLDDPAFVRDFRELFQYYKNTSLLQLRLVESRLLAVFKVGESLNDVKVFRWEAGVDGSVRYIDNRGERDAVYPPQFDFEWTPTSREDFVHGEHPHVSILDQLFVDTVGGDLTIKIENNTADGLGIYREPVDEADQSLDDAAISYAKLGALILLRVVPYREELQRFFVFNTRTKKVRRIDEIGHACVQLPEDHGIIFPGGYYLRGGETKSFDQSVEGMQFIRAIRSPNGEDVLYVFYRRSDGQWLLLPYNMIRKEVVNLLSCHGFSLFEDGKMIIFSATSGEPARVHPVQLWKTPFESATHVATRKPTGTYLEKVGNADLVRGISDALGICRMISDQDPRREIYEDLIASCTRMADSYYWLGHAEIGLLGTIREIQVTAEQVIDEFEKVEALEAQASSSVAAIAAAIDDIIRGARPESWRSIEDYVGALAALRAKRGQIISLRELRYVDRARLDELEARVVTSFDDVSRQTLGYLLQEESLAPYRRSSEEIEARISTIDKVTAADAGIVQVETVAGSLNMLIEVLDTIAIDDATVRIGLLDRISSLMGGLNRIRAMLAARRKELFAKEGAAEFGVQFNLLEQNMTNALARAASPESCDTELSKLLLLLENLETRFGELEDYLDRLTTKREEIFEAFSARRQSLLDERQRRADQLMTAANRILDGIVRRSESFVGSDALNAFFASDPMVEKLHDTSRRLRDLGDVVRADEIDGRRKAAKSDAARSLRDRADIFEVGASIIRLGEHRFSVNTQKLELTMLPRDGRMVLHLTGTSFFQTIESRELDEARELWTETHVSESAGVYRGEFLAASILDAAERGENGLSFEHLATAALGHDELLSLVRDYSVSRYDEGYERGVHDDDATRILTALVAMLQTGGLLRYTPAARAAAALFWASFDDRDRRAELERQAQSMMRLRRSFASSGDGNPL
ncbi:MAG: DNA repair ATPase, partial [Acidobacteria bacterium]|nr:DNA repair ATPase [Acidobacteriota bacterium]